MSRDSDSGRGERKYNRKEMRISGGAKVEKIRRENDMKKGAET